MSEFTVESGADLESVRQEEESTLYRRLERDWQEEIGQHLLDVPHQLAGSALVFEKQFERIADHVDLDSPGIVVEVGCGRGHLLDYLRRRCSTSGPKLIGVDLSSAALAAKERGLVALRGDGENLPLRSSSVRTILYDGALHHLIDYPEALRDAYRALAPGGSLVLFEPVSSPFSRLVHRVLDPLVFRKIEYESPIDQHYKERFREQKVVESLRDLGMRCSYSRTDFLAYPLTGCYAGSLVARSTVLMRLMIALETLMSRIPVLRWLGKAISWRFLIVAIKRSPGTSGAS